jgi:hypothetical protein
MGRRSGSLAGLAALLLCAAASAQPAPQAPAPFAAGAPLGVTVAGQRTPISPGVKVYGAFNFAESCSYDPGRKLIVAVNRGASQSQVPNDGFISLINSDGSVHTPKWIGETRNGLVLNDPLGSDIEGGKLYVADRDPDPADPKSSVSAIRVFDMKTGAPAGQIVTPGAAWFNDIEVARDGTIYATQTGGGAAPQRLYKVAPDGTATVLVDGAPLALPNGVAIDTDGNVVVVNMGSAAVQTFSPRGALLKTETAAQPGSDGLVIARDGTKYVSSVREGGVSRIRPGRPAELIASGIPSAASMCHDEGANQLVIPMNPNNAIALVKLNSGERRR